MAALLAFWLAFVSVGVIVEDFLNSGRKTILNAIPNPNGGEGVNLTYSDADATVDDMTRLRLLVTADTVEEDAVRHMLLMFKVGWNLKNYVPCDDPSVHAWIHSTTGIRYAANADGTPILRDVPPTFEGMRTISLKLLVKIMQAIQADMAPKATTPETFVAG